MAMQAPHTTAANDNPYRIHTLDELRARAPQDWVINGFLPSSGLACGWGPPGSGKSFVFSVALPYCVAMGLPFHGLETKKGAVVLIVAEGEAGMCRRLDAICRKEGVDPAEVQIFVMEASPNLSVGSRGQKELDEVIASIRDFFEGRGIDGPVLIVVDTLSRTFGPGSQNDSTDMGNYIAGMDHLRRQFGCAVLIVHHSGWDNSHERGSTALRGAVDASYSASKSGRLITVKVVKQKDADDGGCFHFELVDVPADSQDHDDSEKMAPVAVPAEKAANDNAAGSGARSKYEGIVKEAIRSAPVEGLTASEWQKRSQDLGLTRKATFYDLKSKLIAQGQVNERDGRFHIVDATQAGGGTDAE